MNTNLLSGSDRSIFIAANLNEFKRKLASFADIKSTELMDFSSLLRFFDGKSRLLDKNFETVFEIYKSYFEVPASARLRYKNLEFPKLTLQEYANHCSIINQTFYDRLKIFDEFTSCLALAPIGNARKERLFNDFGPTLSKHILFLSQNVSKKMIRKADENTLLNYFKVLDKLSELSKKELSAIFVCIDEFLGFSPPASVKSEIRRLLESEEFSLQNYAIKKDKTLSDLRAQILNKIS